MPLTAAQFTEFFRALHGYDPFPWQAALAARLCDPEMGGRWPECLALPTGTGKTSCLDIAVFALALQADWPAERRTAPRRILFVVDRRIIVDEACAHARKLADTLAEAKSGILAEVGNRLRQLAGGAAAAAWNPLLAGQRPLTVHSLRGGAFRDEAWALTPTQPCIITSTVDQAGSRLLFRGYGRGSKAWPVLAGLVGNDTLVLLDEAHCSQPFYETMSRVARYRAAAWAETALENPFQFAILSATPPAGADDVWRLQEADRDHPVLIRRLGSAKPAQLVRATTAKGSRFHLELAFELVSQLLPLLTSERRSVGIMVNRVRTAQLIYELLALVLGRGTPRGSMFGDARVKALTRQLTDWSRATEPYLLTGRMRPLDQERSTRAWIDRLRVRPDMHPPAESEAASGPLVIISTQTLEVGADLDFDALLTECASLDALRQRFGRLNRAGRHTTAPAVIVAAEENVGPKSEPDPIYGTALGATWNWLEQHSASAEYPASVDLGVWALEPRLAALAPEQQQALVRAGQPAPVLLPAHLDLLVQTAPIPQPSPDLQPFLHGWQTREAEVQVCWRGDLRLAWLEQQADRDEATVDLVSLCPPTAAECLPVPLPVLRRWWEGELDNAIDEGLADVAAEPLPEANTRHRNQPTTSKQAFVWRGPEESQWISGIADVRPGDTLIIPQEVGGVDSLGYVPAEAQTALDVGDLCAWQSRQRALLRLHPALLSQWTSAGGGAVAVSGVQRVAQLLGVDMSQPDRPPPDEWEVDEGELRQALGDLGAGAGSWLTAPLAHLDEAEFVPHPAGGLVLQGPRPAQAHLAHSVAEWPEPDRDADAGLFNQGPVELGRHLQGVTQHALHFARVLGLPERLLASLELAAQWHDAGKADNRFQTWLHGGNAVAAQLAGALWAKSAEVGLDRAASRRAAWQSRLPSGFRHELLSSQLLQASAAWADLGAAVDRDLVLHLIEAHHGHCRPFAPVVLDDAPQALDWSDAAVAFDVPADVRASWPAPHRLDSGVAERFWRLVRRYGWWGLAWLESILFLADHRESELESWQAPVGRPGGNR
jgi:CRISPR-associated endonuclease/helicase Cas3